MARYATIDIGSNTILLLVVDSSSGELVSVVDECEFGRLSQGLSAGKQLHPESIARSLGIITRYAQILDEHDVDGIACVGTQALREAENREDFVKPAESILGASIEIIAGEREAELVATAVRHSFPDLCAGEVVTVDVGGASTEFIVIRAGQVCAVKSLPIGAVRLSERYLRSDPPTAGELSQLSFAIDSALEELELPRYAPLIGTAGTATTLASIELELPSYQPQRIHGLELSTVQVHATFERLAGLSLAEKQALAGLESQRADIIVGGVAIYSRVLERLGSSRFVVSDRGVRWGLAYELASA